MSSSKVFFCEINIKNSQIKIKIKLQFMMKNFILFFPTSLLLDLFLTNIRTSMATQNPILVPNLVDLQQAVVLAFCGGQK
jgi:hypothetical protein